MTNTTFQTARMFDDSSSVHDSNTFNTPGQQSHNSRSGSSVNNSHPMIQVQNMDSVELDTVNQIRLRSANKMTGSLQDNSKQECPLDEQ